MEREGWIGNFDAAADGTLSGHPDKHSGREFSDSEVYKLLEAMAWEIGRTGDADARGPLPRAGRPDRRRAGARRLPQHELRPARSAPAVLRPGVGPRAVLLRPPVPGGGRPGTDASRRRRRPARRGPARRRPRGRHVRPGRHRVGLRAPGDRAGARRAGPPDRRAARTSTRPRCSSSAAAPAPSPTSTWAATYFQDDVPVREATVLRGHAVRANYLAAGAVDVAVETDDTDLLDALTTQWETTVARRTYVTGGQGSHHEGESFGDDFELPPDRAYSETCAGIGSVMFSWRLLLAQGLPRYADLVERTLYNVVATSPVGRGHRVLLHEHAAPARARARSRRRTSRAPGPRRRCVRRGSPCPAARPTSPARWPAWRPTSRPRTTTACSCTSTRRRASARRWPTAAASSSTSTTAYPRDGVVRVTVATTEDRPWTLTLRVPAWAQGAHPGDPGRRAAGPDRHGRRAPGLRRRRRRRAAPAGGAARVERRPAHRRGPRLRGRRARAGGALRRVRRRGRGRRRPAARPGRRAARGRRAGAGDAGLRRAPSTTPGRTASARERRDRAHRRRSR